ncbi:hypothetical protein B0H12DRAFT_1275872 [Mycena haematopus]|nr:hypothetical protein B0H12DRAFT_1275872 [Mycena haematopus]
MIYGATDTHHNQRSGCRCHSDAGQPAFGDADAGPVADTLRQFGVTAPIVAVLRSLEATIDSFAFAMIDLIPTREADVSDDKNDLDMSVGNAIALYGQLCIQSPLYPALQPKFNIPINSHVTVPTVRILLEHTECQLDRDKSMPNSRYLGKKQLIRGGKGNNLEQNAKPVSKNISLQKIQRLWSRDQTRQYAKQEKQV